MYSCRFFIPHVLYTVVMYAHIYHMCYEELSFSSLFFKSFKSYYYVVFHISVRVFLQKWYIF